MYILFVGGTCPVNMVPGELNAHFYDTFPNFRPGVITTAYRFRSFLGVRPAHFTKYGH